MLAIMRVKVWRHVIIEIHADDDPKETADFWHWNILDEIIQPNKHYLALGKVSLCRAMRSRHLPRHLRPGQVSQVGYIRRTYHPLVGRQPRRYVHDREKL